MAGYNRVTTSLLHEGSGHHGRPRKGNTYRAAERIREILQEKDPVEWEYVMLRDINLEQCRGCFLCLSKGEEFCH